MLNPILYFALSPPSSQRTGPQIKSHLKKSKLSFFKPVLDMKGERRFVGINFDAVEQDNMKFSASFNSC